MKTEKIGKTGRIGKVFLAGICLLILSIVTAAVPMNGTVNYNVETTGVTTISSTGAVISWSETVPKDARIYFGLNEQDVGTYTGGQWSDWYRSTIEPKVRITGLKANTTYYYKIQKVVGGVQDDSAPVVSIKTLKPGVWSVPAEAMISSVDFNMISPTNFRTINISAAPLNANGRYVTGLGSLTATVKNNLGNVIGTTTLTGDGPYYGSLTIPDYLSDSGLYITITGYPDIKGEISVLRWGCVNCHSAGGDNYPSTFDVPTVHPKHYDTTIIYVTKHFGTRISTLECGGMCHELRYPDPSQNVGDPTTRHQWPPHPKSLDCQNCHRQPSGGVTTVTCNNCHADKAMYTDLLSQRYGEDAHNGKKICSDCHDNLPNVTSAPNCQTCHPAATGKTYLTIPTNIKAKSHSLAQTVDCGLCHNNEHDVKLLTNDSTTCRSCHVGITHDAGAECNACHGSDIHNITSAGGEDCIACHGTNYPGANPMARTTLVNISAFNESIHQNINATRIPEFRDNMTTNDDCWQCHYQKDMNRANVRGCNYCHRNVNEWHGNANITTDWSHLW